MKKITSIILLSISFLTACNTTNLFKESSDSSQNQSSEVKPTEANKMEVKFDKYTLSVDIPSDYSVVDKDYLPSADVQALSTDKWSIVGLYVDEKAKIENVKNLDEFVARLEESNSNFIYEKATVDGKVVYADESEYKQKNSNGEEESVIQLAYVTETENCYVILVADGKPTSKQKHIDTLNYMLQTLKESQP